MDFNARIAEDNRTISAAIGTEIKLISPAGETVEIKAIFRDISQITDPNFAVPVSVRNIDVKVNIDDLTAENYPFRLLNGDIYLNGHKVEIKYPTGEKATFEVVDFRPDFVFRTINLVLDKIGQRKEPDGRF